MLSNMCPVLDGNTWFVVSEQVKRTFQLRVKFVAIIVTRVNVPFKVRISYFECNYYVLSSILAKSCSDSLARKPSNSEHFSRIYKQTRFGSINIRRNKHLVIDCVIVHVRNNFNNSSNNFRFERNVNGIFILKLMWWVY